MKTVKLFCLFFVFTSHVAMGQNDYIVKTAPAKSTAATEEERFVENNFPYSSLCNWEPGMKFMYIIEGKYGFIPTFYSYETNQPVDNNTFHQKVMIFQGVEETQKETRGSVIYSTRFVFETDGNKYYHEFKNQRLNDICVKSPRTNIIGLVYLDDVDKARELLTDTILYNKVTKLRVDDSNSANSYREVNVPVNTELRVTAIGVGSRECPVKIVFEDKDGRSYYAEVSFSTINSGLIKADFMGENINKYFPNVFSFSNQLQQTVEEIKERFSGNYIYPKQHIQANLDGKSTTIFRFTPLKIIDMDVSPDKISAVLKVQDSKKNVYTIPTKLKYDIFLKNEDYIEDMFGQGNLRAEHPTITEETWELITNGEVRPGMNKDECRLALGSPIRIDANLNSRYENWYYHGKVLEFEDGLLAKIK